MVRKENELTENNLILFQWLVKIAKEVIYVIDMIYITYHRACLEQPKGVICWAYEYAPSIEFLEKVRESYLKSLKHFFQEFLPYKLERDIYKHTSFMKKNKTLANLIHTKLLPLVQ